MSAPGPAIYSDTLEAAIRLATRGHYFQFRKGFEGPVATPPLPDGAIPYVAHLSATALILASTGADAEVVAAALLHDYLEDVDEDGAAERIAAEVGPGILALVREVTEDKRPELPARTSWRARKQEQLDHIADMPEPAVLIKTADALHNLRSLLFDLDAADDPSSVWSRFNASPEDELWYFAELAQRTAGRLGAHPLATALGRAVATLGERIRTT